MRRTVGTDGAYQRELEDLLARLGGERVGASSSSSVDAPLAPDEDEVAALSARGEEILMQLSVEASRGSSGEDASERWRKRLRTETFRARKRARDRAANRARAALVAPTSASATTLRRRRRGGGGRRRSSNGDGDGDASGGGDDGAQRITKSLTRTVTRAQESLGIVERTKETLADDDESLLRIGGEHRAYKETVKTSGSFLDRLRSSASVDRLVDVVGMTVFLSCVAFVMWQRVRFRIPFVGWVFGLG